jgi:hypothetical protein
VWTVRGSGAADLAESYNTNDESIQAAQVVSIDPELRNGVKKSSGAYDPHVVGVISTRPNIVMGGEEAALSAKIPNTNKIS